MLFENRAIWFEEHIFVRTVEEISRPLETSTGGWGPIKLSSYVFGLYVLCIIRWFSHTNTILVSLHCTLNCVILLPLWTCIFIFNSVSVSYLVLLLLVFNVIILLGCKGNVGLKIRHSHRWEMKWKIKWKKIENHCPTPCIVFRLCFVN